MAFAKLTNSVLTGAKLYRVSSGGIIGRTWSLPTNWLLTNGYLVGPGADPSSADLSGADLSGADLTNADLRGTELLDADFTGADLTGSTWDSGSPGSVLSAQLAAAEAQLANEYTLEEIADLRPGSSMIEIVDGQATMNFRVQVSDNMVDWFDTAETSDVTLPASDPGKKFFRFHGPE